jgi:hypothetical protein
MLVRGAMQARSEAVDSARRGTHAAMSACCTAGSGADIIIVRLIQGSNGRRLS